MDINCVVINGRLTRDAELRYTSSGMAVSKLSVAVNRRVKKDGQWTDEANFFDVVLWGKTAVSLNQYLTKGQQVGVQGELRQNRWQQDGQSRSKVEISATSFQLLGGKSNRSAPNPGGDRPGSESKTEPFVDDIPF